MPSTTGHYSKLKHELHLQQPVLQGTNTGLQQLVVHTFQGASAGLALKAAGLWRRLCD